MHLLRDRSLGLLLFGWLAGVAMAAPPDDSSVPIRIVRVGHGNVPVMKENILAAVEACRILKKLPPATPRLPADSALAALAVVEEEELFAGQMWAQYSTVRQYGGDAAQGCRLTLFVQRAAVIEQTCVSRLRGQGAVLGRLMDPTGAPEEPIEVNEDPLPARSCAAKRRAPLSTEGVPSVDAGGARCRWTGAVLAKAMGKPAPTGDEGFDTCQYDKRPAYLYQGDSRPVVLMTRTGDRSPTGGGLSTVIGAAAAPGNQQLQSFAEGPPIAATRFSRAALEAFIRQPSRVAAGEPP